MNLAALGSGEGMRGQIRPRHGGELVMGRAISAISGSAIALLPRPFALLKPALLAFWHEMTRDMGGPYRPERHYMRGPGPKWRAKHGLPPL
jgi:hypothetical protein